MYICTDVCTYIVYTLIYVDYIHVYNYVNTVPDIIKFTYYHCTLYNYKWNSHITMITVQSNTIVLLRSTVDYHLIKG